MSWFSRIVALITGISDDDDFPENPPDVVPTPTPLPPLEDDYLRFINGQRELYGRPKVLRDLALEKLATDWAIYMSQTALSHGDFAGRIETIYPNRLAAENVAYGRDSAQDTVEQWMDSTPHRANILGDFTHVGMGRGSSTRHYTFWCADFVRM